MQQWHLHSRRHPPDDSSTTFSSTQWTDPSTSDSSFFQSIPSSTSFTSPTLVLSPVSAEPAPATPQPSTFPSAQSSSLLTTPTETTSLLITAAVTTSRDGQSITSTLPSPTLVNTTSDSSSASRLPVALIVGLIIGLFVLVLLIIAAIFAYRRRKRSKDHANEPTRSMPNRRRNVGFLPVEGDDFEDDAALMRNAQTSAPVQSLQSSYVAGASPYRPGSPSPSLLRSRVSETGSIFREEVWPPPGFVDPIEMTSSQVNLGTIVDDVMGPSDSTAYGRERHRRELTDSTIISSMPLLFEHPRGDSSEDGSSPPMSRSSSPSPFLPVSPDSPPPHSGPVTGLPLGALPPVVPRSSHLRHMSSSTSSSAHSASSISTQSPTIVAPPVSYRPPSFAGSTTSTIPRSQPKVSSPLVRALSGFGAGR